MTHWAYCEDLTSDSAVVGDTEAHHLLHVLRLGVGAELILFDGLGTNAEAVVTSATRRDVTCRILGRKTHVRSTTSSLTVFVSPPKADRLKWVVEKLTEIGVDRMVLLNTQRTVVTPGETRVDKLKANVVAACKQCHRPYLMELLPLQTFTTAIEQFTSESRCAASFFAHPGLNSNGDASLELPPGEINLLIGPEGGFTDNEVATATSAGLQTISWPGTILRIETAAIVFATMLMSQHRKEITA
jgi:16S rRNA (uracil1498-N3)-methyltransferase